MKRIQKSAWFTIATILFASMASITTMLILYPRIGFPRAAAGLAFFGILGLLGFIPIYLGKATEPTDERDVEINYRAAFMGFLTAYLLLGALTMVPFIILGHQTNIRVVWLPMIFMGCGLGYYLAYSIAIIVQYGGSPKDEGDYGK